MADLTTEYALRSLAAKVATPPAPDHATAAKLDVLQTQVLALTNRATTSEGTVAQLAGRLDALEKALGGASKA